MRTTKQIDRHNSFGVVIDVQDFFLAMIDERRQREITVDIGNFARLLGYFQIPLVVTLEKPVKRKGPVPQSIVRNFGAATAIFEKEFFDLTREKKVAEHLRRANKRQALLGGCETDVCVLQSCLGLLRLGYDVFLVEELLFSSTRNVEAAITRMKDAGAVVLSYKSLFYDLVESVDGGRHSRDMRKRLGVFPENLPDSAAGA